jgi:hypothetical protein
MATNPIKNVGGHKTTVTATISTETDGLSDVIDLGGYAVHTIQTSTAWTAANIAFNASALSSGTLTSLRHTTACTQLAYATTVDYNIAVDPYLFNGVRYLQLASRNSTDGAVVQAAERSIVLGLNTVTESR